MNKTLRLVWMALFSALLGLVSQLALPLPAGIPLTLQTFAAALCGRVLGPSSAAVSLSVWLILGAAGVPLFSGFRGGMSVLLGPTGGFLAGLLLLAVFCGLAPTGKKLSYAVASVTGLILCHLTGLLWCCFVTKQPFFTAFVTLSFMCFPKDILSLIAAEICGRGLLKAFPFLERK
ncbi:MAG: biotin transporter BioY [Clostridia bacterium]|nr:biotin transporter BioY [Clostridia bacterium]